jgi:hypothetical protein
MFKNLSIYSFAAILASSFSIYAATNTTATPTKTEQKTTNKINGFTKEALIAAANASKTWLAGVDSMRYAESWENLAALAKLTIHKDEWTQLMDKTRRPLGAITSREVQDERTAKDPSGMPKGDYVVMFYKTQFSHKTAYELVTLFFEDGQWRVLTYQIDTQ